MRNCLLKFAVLSSVATLAACQTTSNTVPLKTGVSSVRDAAERNHMSTQTVTGDFIALAESVTNRMLVSREVASWGSKRPRLLIGNFRNRTSDETIPSGAISSRITEVVIESGVAKVVQDKSAINFDYIINSRLTSQTHYDGTGASIANYSYRMQMLDKDGVVVGQWTEDASIGTSGR